MNAEITERQHTEFTLPCRASGLQSPSAALANAELLSSVHPWLDLYARHHPGPGPIGATVERWIVRRVVLVLGVVAGRTAKTDGDGEYSERTQIR